MLTVSGSWIILLCNYVWNNITINYFIYVYYWLVDVVRHTISFLSPPQRSEGTSYNSPSRNFTFYMQIWKNINKNWGAVQASYPNTSPPPARYEFLVSSYELSKWLSGFAVYKYLKAKILKVLFLVACYLKKTYN